jgi:hypothetical protein
VECAFLPNVVPLSASELVCFYRLGSAFYSADGRLAKLRSTDGGKTWSREGLVWDPQDDETSYSYTAPHGTRLRDGSMVLIANRRDRSDPDQLVFNPETGGMRPWETILFRSTDGGHEWSAPEVVQLPGGGVADTPSQIIELNDGRWFLACELWKTWDDTTPLHIKGFALFSDDWGETWGDRIDFPSAEQTDKMYSHSRYTQMLDGRIAALQWTQEIGGDTNLDLHLVMSDQTGTLWSTPKPTGLTGQTSWMVDLGEGTLVAAYSNREGMRPGVYVVTSEDEGETWDLDNQVMIWDAVGQEFLGVEHKPSYPASHDNIAFGKPNCARLSKRRVMCSWWCTQACVTHSRFAILDIV